MNNVALMTLYQIMTVVFMAMNALAIVWFLNANTLLAHNQILAAIKDSGCSTHQHKVIEQKQIKDTYNIDSLGGE